MSDAPTQEEVHDAIDRVIADFLDEAGVYEPPIDAVALVQTVPQALAILEQAATARGGSRKNAVLRAEPTDERRQWLAAHALAEQLQDEVLSRLGLEALPGSSLANLLADRLLTPTEWLGDEARANGYDLFALKERFPTVGHELLAWRLLDLPQPCIITIIDNGMVQRRRANTGRAPRDLAPPEEQCLEVVHRTSRPHDLNADGWRVQGWPIHTVDWRREVLRSVMDEEAW